MRSQSLWPLVGFVAAALFAPAAQAASLSASVFVTGLENDVTWAIDINNSNAFALMNASISNVSITQTAGPAATPVIMTTLPISLGTIAANSTAVGDLNINFTGASLTSLFDLNASLNADGLTASQFFANLPPQIPDVNGLPFSGPFPGTVTIASTPLPAALPLFTGGLGALGFLSWRRKRKAACQ